MPQKWYIAMVSVHGRIRANDLELGVDADTGGQVRYVVDLCRQLSQHPQCGHIDLFTRRFWARPTIPVDPVYSMKEERITDTCTIQRLACGAPHYIAKEKLWDVLPDFADSVSKRITDMSCRYKVLCVHGHYADGAWVARLVSKKLYIPMVVTGHSLGKTKRATLQAAGVSESDIKNIYSMDRRLSAEEECLHHSDMVVVSTKQEWREQWSQYDRFGGFRGQREVIPPGTRMLVGNLHVSKPTQGKRILLTIGRFERKKNLGAVLNMIAGDEFLRRNTHAVVLTNDSGIAFITQLAQDLGIEDIVSVMPGTACNVADAYGATLQQRGLVVNLALHEPFGLTLVEAAQFGIPVLSTNNGGCVETVASIGHGISVDPLDVSATTRAACLLLQNDSLWNVLHGRALTGISLYSWKAHVDKYLQALYNIPANS